MLSFPRKPHLADYFMASSIEEALAYLMAHHGKAQLVAGGTLLMPQMQRGECIARQLVDISRVSAMKRVTMDGDRLVIGGAVTLASLADSDLVRAHAPLLYQAARAIATPKVRYLATLAGNVIAAEGSAQGALALVALDAEAQITNTTGSQWLPVESLFVRAGLSRVDSTSEIATLIRVPTSGRAQGQVLDGLTPRAPGGRAPLLLALCLSLSNAEQTIDWASVAIGSITTPPHHLSEAESALADAFPRDPRTRARFTELVAGHVMRLVPPHDASSNNGDHHPWPAKEVVTLAARVFEHAAEMALQSLAPESG